MNPFRYTGPVGPEDVIDRDDEIARLVAHATSGDNSRLVAPRQFGKTSLLGKVRASMPRKGWVSVYVDFFGVLTVDDVAQRIERAYSRQLTGRLATWFSGLRATLAPTLRAGGGALPVGVEVGGAAQTPTPSLLDMLALPRRLHEKHNRRVLVVFDEFQDVLGVGENLDAVIRSEIQHHGAAASYIFAGSEPRMMAELFGDRRRAFYGQAIGVGLPPLPADALAEYVSGRFETTGKTIGPALDALLAFVAGHPQRSMLLAHAVWDATPPGGDADEEAWYEALHWVRAEVDDQLSAIWRLLSKNQRRVLSSLATGQSPYAASRGGKRGGSMHGALRGLMDRGEIQPRRQGDDRIIDPLFADWVRELSARPGRVP